MTDRVNKEKNIIKLKYKIMHLEQIREIADDLCLPVRLFLKLRSHLPVSPQALPTHSMPQSDVEKFE